MINLQYDWKLVMDGINKMDKLLKLATKIAKQLTDNQYKMVAILTDRKGKILSIGTNSYSKTHTEQARYAKLAGQDARVYLHAEIDAITKCRGKAHTIYVVRVNNAGQTRPAKPCPICAGAIKEIGIKNILYT